MAGKEYYITQKLDGCSFTAYHDGDRLHVASRNHELVVHDDSIWWRIADKYELEHIMEVRPWVAIQGEITGPGIQKNRLGLETYDLSIFNAYDMKQGAYYGMDMLWDLCYKQGLRFVPILSTGKEFNLTEEDLIQYANANTYDNGHPQKGIVVRPVVSQLHPLLGQLSFKVVSEEFLLKIG
jgi:RNA ligase (TIGR02306 family)